MKNPSVSLSSSALYKTALITLGCALAFAVAPTPALNAADSAALQSLAAEKGKSLPVTTTFEKVKGGESGPYVLKVKNVSKGALNVSAKVLLSVAFHADSKARKVPEHVIEAGQVWSIPDLAAADKVIIASEGFDPLEVVVP